MFDEFKKAQEEKEKNTDPLQNTILPDNASTTELAEDGKPMTDQIKGILEMREELADSKPTNMDIVLREPDLPPSNQTINSSLSDIPKLCDQCYLIDKCAHYQKGATCYFRNQVTVRDSGSLVDLMKMMLEIQGERVMFGRLIEQSEGGYLDGNLSKEMKLLMDLMKDFKDVLSPPKEEIVIKATGQEATKSGGLLSQLFGGGGGEG